MQTQVTALLLSTPDVLRMLGRKSRSGLHDLIKRDPTFPRPVRLGGRPQWRRDELEEYVNGLPKA